MTRSRPAALAWYRAASAVSTRALATRPSAGNVATPIETVFLAPKRPLRAVLELTAVIRNRATFKQALPAVEVTLTDARNRPIARKVFTPADYLAAAGEPSSRIDDGFASGSDYTIRIFFEARGVQAAGFLVYPFFI